MLTPFSKSEFRFFNEDSFYRSFIFKPFPFTVLGWEVQDIEKIAEVLKERGVNFEKYEGMRQTDLGIWNAPGGAKVAWFKDPDGNLLSLSQH